VNSERSQALSDISKWKDRQVNYIAPLSTKRPILEECRKIIDYPIMSNVGCRRSVSC